MNHEENKPAAKRGLMIQTEHEGRKTTTYSLCTNTSFVGKAPATLAWRYGQLGKAPDRRLGNAPQHDSVPVPCIPDKSLAPLR